MGKPTASPETPESGGTATKEDQMSAFPEAYEWRGRSVVDRDGQKLGKLDEIYLDRETNQPEWALVDTGLFGTKSSFVPLKGATPAGEEIRVAYAKDQVKDAPSIEADGELSQREEAELYRHYGLQYSEVGSGGGLPEGTTPATGGRPEREDAMTRSEEELRVGTAERERGRVRLRKRVETDEVQESVPVRREQARVEREPITDENVDEAMRGPELSEAEHEVTLREEEPVVEKRTVPKERVRLEKDVETDEEQVSDQVRKERVDVEDDR
jgi:uncharacterized protein (TIGR02271 family)